MAAKTTKKKTNSVSLGLVFLTFLVLVAAFVGLIFLQEKINPLKQQSDRQTSGSTTTTTSTVDELTSSSLPKVSPSDWSLVLVNRDNQKEEMSPELAEVSGIQVDSRIAEATAGFLAAAQAINPNVHLVSGYRSVDEQKTQYETYVQQEMEARGIDQAAAETVVQAYAQPGGANEHMTGLAIDMSTVDTLNQMDEGVAAQLAEIAPDYGFVLRYKAEYTDQTGVGYEDWHFRYVGTESARYMADHDMSLESYLDLLNNPDAN